ncbi:unknown [Haloarcula marismortui ATCC 43049]|uniref:Uncharacterized protein n=1 Tax=Haloarcula marismortui (strain ATCC 43049 / DSM 3752 / JCM 8966 / VKM B-1809) TaxID=272569 RepID=Q5V5F1_HALMA|nr:unknown [Haloarcula marismortui ATCC 43049]
MADFFRGVAGLTIGNERGLIPDTESATDGR